MNETREIVAKAWELALLYAGPQLSNVAAFNASRLPGSQKSNEERIKELEPIAQVFIGILSTPF